jgi:hypothetical protein
MNWKLTGEISDEDNVLLVQSNYTEEIHRISVDSFKTFLLIFKSLVVLEFPDVSIQRYPFSFKPSPELIDDVSLFYLTETKAEGLDTEYALVWNGLSDAKGVYRANFLIQLSKRAGAETKMFLPMRMCTLLSVVDKALSETTKTLSLRRVLKSSREDLVAQLYKPSRVGVDEATFDRYFPESGEEMYGTFQFKGGKRKN